MSSRTFMAQVGVSQGRHVLMLLENNPYPNDRRVLMEAKALVTAGYQVSVICPMGPGQPWREMVEGVKVYRYPAPSYGNSFLAYLWEYSYSMVATFVISLFVFLHDNFHVVHAHNPPDTFFFIAAFYKLLGKRFVFDHHDLAPEMYRARLGGGGHQLVYRALVLLEKLSCRLADHVIATNQSYKTVEMQRGNVPEDRITVVRNGPDLNAVKSTVPDPLLRQKKKTIIVYVGVMGFQDGVDYLLRALHHLVEDVGRTDFFCVLVGTGAAIPHLKMLAERLGLAEYVGFAGWVPHGDVARYICAADICVAPEPSNSYNDRSTTIKMMEYMAFSKPIVAFDLPEHRVTAKNAALYARPNEELHLAQRITLLMDDPKRREKLGRIGKARVEKELAWQYQIRNLLEAYQGLAMR